MRRISVLSTSYLLVLGCALLLTYEVKCQDSSTVAPSSPSAPGDATGQTLGPQTAVSAGAGSTQAQAPGDTSAPVIIPTSSVVPEVAAAEKDGPITPVVECVGKEEITESNAIKASVMTSDCATTKKIIEAVPAYWCSKQACKLNVHQDSNTVLLESEGANLGTLASALQSDEMKTLGASDVKYTSPSGSSVFVGILVTGLLAAVALTVGYFKCQRRPSPKGERLAEEGTPVDQQNQANTLASDAPLNPPPESPEKPSANGDAPEGDKTQAPPTNGHSTPANTADTEL